MIKASDSTYFTAKFGWKIKAISKIEASEILSETFQVCNVNWQLKLHPRGEENFKGKSISIFLQLANPKSLSIYWSCRIKYEFAIIGPNNNKVAYACQGENGSGFRTFTRDSSVWGWYDFLPLSKLSQYVDTNDNLLVEAKIFFKNRDSEPTDISYESVREIKDKSSYQTNLKSLINDKTTSDVTFELQYDEKVTEIYAHKSILASRSSYFRKMFFEVGMREKHENSVKIPNINPHVFLQTLEFLYMGRLNLQLDSAVELLEISNHYNIEKLVRECSNFISENLHVDTVSKILYRAYMLDMETLFEKCKSYIEKYLEDVSKTEAFCELPEDVLVALLKKNEQLKHLGLKLHYLQQFYVGENSKLHIKSILKINNKKYPMNLIKTKKI